jgi:hypothetical protein
VTEDMLRGSEHNSSFQVEQMTFKCVDVILKASLNVSYPANKSGVLSLGNITSIGVVGSYCLRSR